MAAAAARRRTAKLNGHKQLEDMDIFLLDLDGLPADHALRHVTTRTALMSAPDFATRAAKKEKIPATKKSHELGLYMAHGDAIICSLTFIPRIGNTAFVSNVNCYDHVHPRTYVLFYKMAQLLRKSGIHYVMLRELSIFHRSLGFRSDGVARVSDIIRKTRMVFQ